MRSGARRIIFSSKNEVHRSSHGQKDCPPTRTRVWDLLAAVHVRPIPPAVPGTLPLKVRACRRQHLVEGLRSFTILGSRLPDSSFSARPTDKQAANTKAIRRLLALRTALNRPRTLPAVRLFAIQKSSGARVFAGHHLRLRQETLDTVRKRCVICSALL